MEKFVVFVLIFLRSVGANGNCPVDDGSLAVDFRSASQTRYEGFELDTADVLTAEECARACLDTDGCRTANFDRLGEYCELFDSDPGPPDGKTKQFDDFVKQKGSMFLFDIKCALKTTTTTTTTETPVPQATTTVPADLSEGDANGPNEPIRDACPLKNLKFDAIVGKKLYNSILGASETSDTAECANSCFKRTLCSSADFHDGVCILKSAILDKAEADNSSSAESALVTVETNNTFITNITCDGEIEKDRFFGFIDPFTNWFYNRYRCYNWNYGGCDNTYARGHEAPAVVVTQPWQRPTTPTPYVWHVPYTPRRWPLPAVTKPRVFYVPTTTTTRRTTTTTTTTTTTPKPTPPPPRCGRPTIAPLVSEFSLRRMNPQEGRIIGGSDARPHSWPWQVSINYYGNHLCGGSLIDPYHILTAAHCFKYSTNPYAYRFYLGSHVRERPDRGEQRLKASYITLHPQYDTPRHAYDVAIVRLSTPAKESRSVQPVCLAQSEVRAFTKCVITGWGDTNIDADVLTKSTLLKQVVVPVVSTAKCNSSGYYDGDIHQSMFCAGYDRGGKDSCQGDSGGPFVCPDGRGGWTLQGVVSWGKQCAGVKKPGVYASVARLRAWILKETAD